MSVDGVRDTNTRAMVNLERLTSKGGSKHFVVP